MPDVPLKMLQDELDWLISKIDNEERTEYTENEIRMRLPSLQRIVWVCSARHPVILENVVQLDFMSADWFMLGYPKLRADLLEARLWSTDAAPHPPMTDSGSGIETDATSGGEPASEGNEQSAVTHPANKMEAPDGARRRPGPIPMTADHKKLADIVEPYGADWKEPGNLEQICNAADRKKVFAPKDWPKKQPWRGTLEDDQEKVIKVIETRLKRLSPLR